MQPSEKPTLEYASPTPIPTSLFENGLSKGRMAFLLFLVGVPLAPVGCIGLPFLIGSFVLAVTASVQSERRSVFAWFTLVGFVLLAGGLALFSVELHRAGVP